MVVSLIKVTLINETTIKAAMRSLLAKVFGWEANAILKTRTHLAYLAIMQLRDVIHSLQAHAPATPLLSSSQQLVEASDILGRVVFNAIGSDRRALNDDATFLRHWKLERCAERLMELDLRNYNGKRNALVDKPTVQGCLDLIGSLMDRAINGP